MSKIRDIIVAVIVLIAAILLLKTCNDDAEPIKGIATVYDTVYVHTYHTDTVILTETVDHYIKLPIDTVIDTVVILNNYYTVRYHTDTLRFDSADVVKVQVVVKDTLYMNDISSRIVDWNIMTTTINKTITIEKPVLENGWYVGGGVKLNWQREAKIQLNLGYELCKWRFYSIGDKDGLGIGINYKIGN